MCNFTEFDGNFQGVVLVIENSREHCHFDMSGCVELLQCHRCHMVSQGDYS